MAREFVRSELVTAQALAVNDVVTKDLGVNGLSGLFFHITARQAANNTPIGIDDILGAFGNLTIDYRGQALWAGRLRDLVRVAGLVCGRGPVMTHAAQAANAECGVSFWLPFGRVPYGDKEGFPAVNRGDLKLTLAVGAALGNIVAPQLNIQQVELPGNRFASYVKSTMRTLTPGAVGENDIPLPIGNTLRGVLVNMNTAWRNLNSLGTLNSIRMLAANTERLHTGGRNVLDAYWGATDLASHPFVMQAGRMENTAAAYTQNASTNDKSIASLDWMQSYLYMDFDPTNDDACSFDTRGLPDLVLRGDFAIAEIVRAYPVEVVAAPATK